MAVRGVFIPLPTYPYVEEVAVDFPWFGGFAKQQHQRCATSMHLALVGVSPTFKPLEISSASGYSLGANLSAMHLKKWSKTINAYTSVESAFQSSRIYKTSDGKQIGPLTQYLKYDGKVAKKCVKDASMGLHSYEYLFDGVTFPAPDFHASLFYDYLYLNSLLEEPNKAVAQELLSSDFNCFTDLATRALNTQARSVALFRSLTNMGIIDQVRNPDTFFKLFRVDLNAPKFAAIGAYDNVQLLTSSNQLGVVQLHNTVVSRFNVDNVKRHYDKNFGCVTAANLADARL